MVFLALTLALAFSPPGGLVLARLTGPQETAVSTASSSGGPEGQRPASPEGVVGSRGHAVSLVGRVVESETGEPVPEALVRLEPYGVRILSDDEGRFALRGFRVPSEHCPRVHLVARKDGWELGVLELHLRPGENAAPDVELHPIRQEPDERPERPERPEPPGCARGGRA